jgi:hypothetical protein
MSRRNSVLPLAVCMISGIFAKPGISRRAALLSRHAEKSYSSVDATAREVILPVCWRTVVTTNMRVKRGQKTTMFSWIDQWDDLIDAQTKESKGVTLTVSDWFYRGVTEDGGVLSIDPAYFSITGGRERWLYRVARKHAGATAQTALPSLCLCCLINPALKAPIAGSNSKS